MDISILTDSELDTVIEKHQVLAEKIKDAIDYAEVNMMFSYQLNEAWTNVLTEKEIIEQEKYKRQAA